MQEHEHEEMVPYLDKSVPRRGFRAFIYARDGREKIAESYDEFDLFIHSDDWFATKAEAMAPKKEVIAPKEEIEAPKKPRKKTEE